MQAEFDAAAMNLLELSRATVDDLHSLMKHDNDDEPWRRSFIRAAAATMEAHAHALATMCRLLQDMVPFDLPTSCQNAIDGRQMSTSERIKHTLRAGYACFCLEPEPHFGGREWNATIDFLKCRDRLMHPKSAEDFRVSDSDWESARDGFWWIFSEYNRLQELLLRQYGE